MKRLFNIVLVVLTINLFYKQTVFANQISGAEISWRCIGQDSFMVILVVYRDCNGMAISGSILHAYCNTTSSSITSVNTNPGNSVDITPTCSNSCSRCSSGGCSFPYGIQKYQISSLVVLSSAGSCCDIRLDWEQSSRSSNITTGAAGNDFTIEAELNRCLNPCDNSPIFSNLPCTILCLGQPFTYNHLVYDTDTASNGKLSDSLTYQWTQPLQQHGNPVSWSGQYDYTNPIDYWGFPNQNLPFARGFHLDSHTGDIQFQPTQVEVTVMAIMVKEYRMGVFIGQVTRDIEVIVINCPSNHPPTINTLVLENLY